MPRHVLAWDDTARWERENSPSEPWNGRLAATRCPSRAPFPENVHTPLPFDGSRPAPASLVGSTSPVSLPSSPPLPLLSALYSLGSFLVLHLSQKFRFELPRLSYGSSVLGATSPWLLVGGIARTPGRRPLLGLQIYAACVCTCCWCLF